MTAPLRRSSALEDFADQMRVLQRECAWKREQTHTSLIPYVREEAEEVVEAIESGDPAALCDELGDLLLQVVIHAVIAEEAGDFTLDDVARGVIAKMERRNPHVFGDAVATDTAEVMRLWNAAKAAEKAEKAQKAANQAGNA
jgi:MazG family protein